MVYTEVAYRNAKRGVIVLSDTLEGLFKDLIEWSKDVNPDDLLPATIYDREEQKAVGTVSFSVEGLILGPT